MQAPVRPQQGPPPTSREQQGGLAGVGPGFQPGQQHAGPTQNTYSNGPAAPRPPGQAAAGGPRPQPLANQMQQLKLGPGQVARPVLQQPGPRPGLGLAGPRPPGLPAASGPGLAQRPPALSGPANGHLAPQQHQPVALGVQQRPPGVPGMRPPQAAAAAAAGPPGPARPQAGGVPVGAALPGMQPGPTGVVGRPMGQQQPRGMPGGLAPPSQQHLGAGGTRLPQPGAAMAAGGAPGFTTPSKAGAQPQQQLHGTPPPYALQVSSPSPDKAGGSQAGGAPGQPAMQQYAQQQQQQQQQQPFGLRPPMPPIGGMQRPGMPGVAPADQQQYQQQAHMPGMQPPGMPGAAPPPTHMPGLQPPRLGRMQPQPPGMGAGYMQPRPPMPGVSQPAHSSSKVDPAQVPRPMPYAIHTQVFETRREDTHAIPPAADAPIVVRDRGSCGPRFIRSTLNIIPQTKDILQGATLPLVAIICPLGLQHPGDDPVEVVDCPAGGPVRCCGCKAYVNPYMRWLDRGRVMECALCGAHTEVPQEYQSHTGSDGERRDKYERPELCKGSVEMRVGGEYQVRPPMHPTHFFLIDVSQPAVSSGATAAVCSSLARLLDDLPGGERTRVCVATFDSTIHFYSLRPGQAQPHMLVVPDVTDVYCPLAGNIVVDLAQCKDLVASLLESIPKMFAGSQVQETCGGAALRSAVEALKGGEGGRLHAFLCTLPRRGTLHLRMRDVGRPPTDRDTLDSLLPEGKEYGALAADAAAHQVSVDLFLLAQSYVDVATLGVLPSGTGGSLHHWCPWHPSLDADELFNDIRWTLMRPQGLEAVGRLRLSRGLGVEKYIGSFYRRQDTDLSFPALSCDHAVAAKLVYEEKLPERGEALLQFALLYTTTEGERRVRVHTLALPITQSLGTVFRGADLDAYLSYVSRKVASQVPGHALGACKEAINKATTDALLAYRTYCAAASSSGQLILPEALKLLPLYTLALSKAPVFRVDSRPDVRAAAMWRLLSLPAHKAIPLLYARMVPLIGLMDRPQNAMPVPDKLWLSAERLDPEGLFLLENGFEAFLFVGKAVHSDTLQELFGVPSLEGGDPQRPLLLPVLDTPFNRKVRELLDELRRQRAGYLRLRIVRRGDALETAFYSALVEDRSPAAGMSYIEYLCFLHRHIQNKLS